MKTFKILTLSFLALSALSCQQTLFEDVSKADVHVVESENVRYDGNIITVKKGETVNFNLTGSPDFITFYSGELGHQYIYRKRLDGNIDDIKSATLNFTVWAQYGVANSTGNSTKDQMQVLFVTENTDGTPVFPGLSRNFEQDSIMVEEEIPWEKLVDQNLMPNKPGDIYSKYNPDKPDDLFSANSLSVPLTPYLGKKLTLALVLNKEKKQVRVGLTDKDESIAQSTWHFENMYIETTWKDGRVTKQYPDAFGLTPINMKHETVFADHSDNEFSMPTDKEYGAVKAGVEGYWNFSNLSSGKIDISGCGANYEWKYSWLVSDYLNLASMGTPDTGVKIKDINLPVESYEYTYSKVGTYKATFVMSNENFEDAQQKLVEFVINVVESL
ncbi:DUF5017 domain-containing protein [uncultured Bacteroides sp.]|uniref:DUF5017 domain-containing protein n=1 Tax=uncultured Bacteroides sp. TaxID=162156 RepID=UPI0025DAD427|nr:DUF5017 domain-containing protein [uncultured Bacteroides sp.]